LIGALFFGRSSHGRSTHGDSGQRPRNATSVGRGHVGLRSLRSADRSRRDGAWGTHPHRGRPRGRDPFVGQRIRASVDERSKRDGVPPTPSGGRYGGEAGRMPRPLGGRDHVVRRSPRDGHGARRRSRSFELRNAATLDGGAICTALGSYPQRATSGECTPIAPRDEGGSASAHPIGRLNPEASRGVRSQRARHTSRWWIALPRPLPSGDVARTLFLLRSGEPVPGTRAPMRAVIAVGRGAFAALYRKSYSSRRRVNEASIERWSIPHVAARFAEGIEEETEGLIRWLELRYAQR